MPRNVSRRGHCHGSASPPLSNIVGPTSLRNRDQMQDASLVLGEVLFPSQSISRCAAEVFVEIPLSEAPGRLSSVTGVEVRQGSAEGLGRSGDVQALEGAATVGDGCIGSPVRSPLPASGALLGNVGPLTSTVVARGVNVGGGTVLSNGGVESIRTMQLHLSGPVWKGNAPPILLQDLKLKYFAPYMVKGKPEVHCPMDEFKEMSDCGNPQSSVT